MPRLRHALFCAASLLALSGGATAASMITFDEPGLSNGDNLSGQSGLATSGSAVTYSVSDTSGTLDAFVFDTTPGVNPADTDLFATFDDPTTAMVEMFDPGNILVLGTINGSGEVNDSASGGSIDISFSQDVSTFSINLYDTGDSGSSGVTVFADGVSLGTFGGGLGDNEFGVFTFGPAIGTISRITLDGSGGFDNLQFTAVPAPATLTLLGIGLVGAGVIGRRRRSR